MGKPRMTFSVDTKGTCLLCFSVGQECQPVSLKVLTSFLKVDLKNVFNVAPSANSFFSCVPTLNDVDLQVAVCPRCENVVNRFRHLYLELERAQLRVQECIFTIHKLLETSDQSEDCLLQYRQQMMEKCNPAELIISTGIVENLRKEAMAKCGSLRLPFTASIAKVKLTKLEVDPFPRSIETMKVDQTSSSDYQSCASSTTVSALPDDDGASTESPIFDNLHPSNRNRSKKRKKISIQLPQTLNVSFQRISFKQVKCLACGKILTNSRWSRTYHKRMHSGERPVKCSVCNTNYRDACDLRNHRKRVHRFDHLGQYRDPRVSDYTFKNLLKTLLSSHYDKSVNDRWHCSLCPGRVCRDRSLVEYHLVHDHLEVIKQELLRAQKLQVQLIEPPPQPQVEFYEEDTEILYGELIPDPFSSVAANQADEGHQGPQGLSDAESQQNEPVVNERETITQRRAPGTYYECKFCDKSSSDEHAFREHMRSHSGGGDSRPYTCADCGSNYSELPYLRNHTFRSHRGKVFAQFKKDKTTEEQFQGMLTQIIKSNLRNVTRYNDSTRSATCNICDKRYTNIDNCQIHIVQIHFDEVGAEVMRMQEEDQEEDLVEMPLLTPVVIESTGNAVTDEESFPIFQGYSSQPQSCGNNEKLEVVPE